MKKIAIVVALILITGCTNTTDKNITFYESKDRSKVTALTGETLDGGSFKQVAGKVLVINVWASWCSPCRAEAPTLLAISKKYQEVQFVGILTRDNPATATAFINKFNIDYPTVVDDSKLLNYRKVAAANAIPTTLVIDKTGKVAGRISGAVTVAGLSQLIEKVLAE